MTLHRLARHAVLSLAMMPILTGSVACNMIDAALGRHAHLSNMVPGQSVASGSLQCWLTMEFDRLPEGVDHRDVVVRFTSEALHQPAEFDWEYIATHDFVVPQGQQEFGSGHQRFDASTPSEAPPVGQPFKANFTLNAKQKIDDPPSPLFLNAELIWGGKVQDSTRRTIEHVYERSPGGFF